jgi:hypothetical protein
MRDEKGNKRTEIELDFCNYFSFGIDGKIGYAFDKRRTKSRFCNLVVYGAMGLIKAATPTKTIYELIEKMEVEREEDEGNDFI